MINNYGIYIDKEIKIYIFTFKGKGYILEDDNIKYLIYKLIIFSSFLNSKMI